MRFPLVRAVATHLSVISAFAQSPRSPELITHFLERDPTPVGAYVHDSPGTAHLSFGVVRL